MAKPTIQYYGQHNQAIYTVNRRELNCKLIDRAEQTGRIKFFFNHSLDYIDSNNKSICLIDFLRGRQKRIFCKHILGADGIFSKARVSLKSHCNINEKLTALDYGYKELIIPPGDGGRWALKENFVHVWPRKDLILVALPNKEGTFNCLLIMPLKGAGSFETIKDSRDLKILLDSNFSDLSPYSDDIIVDYFSNPVSKIFTVRCDTWHYQDHLLILGDAAHAIAPFLAMGMNVGFEDCTIFSNLMEMYNGDWEEIFKYFSTHRKQDTDAIADLSMKNLEKLNHSIDQDFHAKWQLERKLWEIDPDQWLPLYAMIAFTNEPFSKIVAMHRIHDEILNNICRSVDVDTLFHTDHPEQLLSEYLGEINNLYSLL